MRALVLVLLMLFATPAFAVAVDEQPLADPAQEQMARDLMKEIRCLQCQNQSIEDSNADLAKDLRILVRERIQMGDSPDNVRAYLVDRYGDWIMLEPPVKPSTWFLWGSPFLFLALVLLAVSRRKAAIGGPTPLSDDEKARLDAILAGDTRREDGQ
ncbi:MAG: cytochrome c-type biogenesis protein CcmH [Alphaproteobacteria bacterium]|nr:MAG: cytochrome c-type biogenesis protein CcmH [Alphaproteobacteria bacterium]